MRLFKLTRLPSLALAGALLSVPTISSAEITTDDILSGYKTNAALAQFYRWFQYYERPEGGIENALGILADDIFVKSTLGEANGHDEYRSRVESLPKEWKNSHQVQSVGVTVGPDAAISLTAEIIYQNVGVLPDGATRTAPLAYEMLLTDLDGALPKISTVTIGGQNSSTDVPYQDAYAENRVRSLIHYWLSIIENPARDASPFRNILAESPKINFSSGLIEDYDGLAVWLAGPGSQVKASTHIIEDLEVADLDGGLWQATMIFDWAGILPDGAELSAKTKHTWVIENDVTEPFARIQQVDVEVLQPFQPRR
ncbi:hypothetical protein [Cognatishimia maritima]|uniref:SnoaL-like domain-containing protein n=1 Tax=Cognatishimia maritima TaxID=870908 RepID=A0A1M5UWR0_9RHOB|nr:hypothetical protein [Cognatishimia maritima]SHH67360.1 hypothetical protein SAMN04488044_2983 [Cognatishimia maritima]